MDERTLMLADLLRRPTGLLGNAQQNIPSGSLLNPATVNPLMAQKFAAQRQNMTQPTSVMDERYPAWKKAQDQADLLLMGADIAGSVAPLLGPTVRGAAMAGKALAPKAADMAEGYMARTGLLQPATVWHGSPHRFDKFDASKIGTGEGAQAYGHGLYFADNPEVAKTYAGAGRAVDRAKDGYSAIEDSLSNLMSKYQDKGRYSEAGAIEELLINRSPAKARQRFADDPKALAEIARHENKFIPSNLYKVDLPDEQIAKMLDYDAPIKNQPAALKAIRDRLPEDMRRSFDVNVDSGISGANAYKNWLWDSGKTEAAKAETLRGMGIPGIRYLDGGSRGAGQGTSNFVVFPGNEGLLKILERQ